MSNPAIINGLPNGVAVKLTVSAVSVAGTSEPSIVSAGVTPVTVPAKPTITNVVAGDKTITVTYNRNTDTGGSVITGDKAIVYRASDNTVLKTVDITSGGTIAVDNGVAVYVKVFSVNANGNGDLSDPSVTVTPLSAPEASPVINASPINSYTL